MGFGATVFDQLIDDPAKPISGLAVIKFKQGQIVFQGGWGQHGATHKRFRIASISKFVMSMLVAQLAAENRLDLDADVSHWLGFELRHPKFPNDPITLTHLLSHTSTLRDATAYSMPLPHQIYEFFEPGSVWFEDGAHFGAEDARPGEFFTYCNLNFGVAATVLEAVTGRRFDLLMRERLFEPLGIKPSYNTGLFTADEIQDLAPILRLKNGAWVTQVDDHKGVVPKPLSVIENPDVHEKYAEAFGHIRPSSDLESYELGTNGTLFSPQGGLRVSADELFVLAKHFCDAYQANEPWAKLMVRPVWRLNEAGSNGDNYAGLMTDWGLGTHLFKRQLAWLGPSFENYIGHLGDAYGLLSGLLFDPEKGDGMIYIIGGTSCAVEENPGRESAFTAWEEVVLRKLL